MRFNLKDYFKICDFIFFQLISVQITHVSRQLKNSENVQQRYGEAVFPSLMRKDR